MCLAYLMISHTLPTKILTLAKKVFFDWEFKNKQIYIYIYIYTHTHTHTYCGGLVTKSCLTLATPWTVACHAPLSLGFFRQGYWSGLPCPPLVDLPDPGIEPLLRESIPRQVDKMFGLPKEEIGVWGSWGGDMGLELSRRRKGQASFFFSTFLSLSHIKFCFL